MFVIKNADSTYALRPEGTASIVRAYLENNLDKNQGLVKFYYSGPMFRLERPQRGRLRQFHHLGCEVIGSSSPKVDVEIISLADTLLKAFAIEDYHIQVNSLGCPKDKKALSQFLNKALEAKLPKLCPDCQERFKRNVLRILDCKNAACKEVVAKLDLNNSHLCRDCQGHAQRVLAGLDFLKIKYLVNPYLVRGLDYYTRTVFEIKHDALGAQDAIGAGGRYDNLVKELGGPDCGAIGFAFGMERLLLAATKDITIKNQDLTYLITLGEAAENEGLKILNDLRRAGIRCDTDYEGKSLKGAMRQANDAKARYVLILGDDELKKRVITLKDMQASQQQEVPLDNLIIELKKRVGN
jgi:histidyl-tRNA synthetase